MKKSRLAPREIILLVFLLVLVVGVVYYMAFYTPMQSELSSIRTQTGETETQLTTATARLNAMDSMQKELDEILAAPKDQITEIAPYDNSKVIMNQLNTLLAPSLEYQLTFADPKFGSDNLVRREVNLSFRCADYTSAEVIIRNLSSGRWRCLVNNLAVSAEEDLTAGEVQASATLTFFESKALD